MNSFKSSNSIAMTNRLDKLEFKVLGTRVHGLQSSEALDVFSEWRNQPAKFRYITSTNLNNVWEAQESEEYYKVMKFADMSLPDGMPMLWYGRKKGYKLPERCGIEEVMFDLFRLSNEGSDLSHYFYGNTPEVLDGMKVNLLKEFPDLKIAGMYSPPFRKLTKEEEKEHIEIINKAKPDFLWVSLGCPKQELWLYHHRAKLRPMVGGGAGAVFNFISGETKKAPKWVQYSGLEWLMRLGLNPRRLYKRYVLKYPKCVYKWAINSPADHIRADNL